MIKAFYFLSFVIIYRPFLSFLKEKSKLIYHIINMLLLKLKKNRMFITALKKLTERKRKIKICFKK